MAQMHKVSGVATVIGFDRGLNYVQYHQTRVVEWNDLDIILNTDGWRTPTTKTRMNQAANQFGLNFCVMQRDRKWFVEYKNRMIPFEGETLCLSRIKGVK